MKYKKGDQVKVYSLQSFFDGGFINGNVGIVSQDQIGGSVLVSVERKIKGVYKIDPSYEVYPEQLKLLEASERDESIESRFDLLDFREEEE